MNHNGKTFVLVKCALLAALAVALNFVKFAPWPNGSYMVPEMIITTIVVGLLAGAVLKKPTLSDR